MGYELRRCSCGRFELNAMNRIEELEQQLAEKDAETRMLKRGLNDLVTWIVETAEIHANACNRQRDVFRGLYERPQDKPTDSPEPESIPDESDYSAPDNAAG